MMIIAYRNEKEIQFWKNRDPIKLLLSSIEEEELQLYKNFCIELEKEINEAFSFAKMTLHLIKIVFIRIFSDL